MRGTFSGAAFRAHDGRHGLRFRRGLLSSLGGAAFGRLAVRSLRASWLFAPPRTNGAVLERLAGRIGREQSAGQRARLPFFCQHAEMSAQGFIVLGGVCILCMFVHVEYGLSTPTQRQQPPLFAVRK